MKTAILSVAASLALALGIYGSLIGGEPDAGVSRDRQTSEELSRHEELLSLYRDQYGEDPFMIFAYKQRMKVFEGFVMSLDGERVYDAGAELGPGIYVTRDQPCYVSMGEGREMVLDPVDGDSIFEVIDEPRRTSPVYAVPPIGFACFRASTTENPRHSQNAYDWQQGRNGDFHCNRGACPAGYGCLIDGLKCACVKIAKWRPPLSPNASGSGSSAPPPRQCRIPRN